jgi:hypothetical protein
METKAMGRARASCHLVLVGEAVEAAPDERSRDSGRDGRRLQLRHRPVLAAPAAGPLAADLGEAVGVNSQGAGLPPSLGHDGAEAACRRARTTVSRRPKRKPVEQPRLAAVLPVTVRASIGMWSKAVVDRPTGQGGGGCRRRGRGEGELRRRAQQRVALGDARRGGSTVDIVRRRRVIAPPQLLPSSTEGTARGERRSISRHWARGR